MTDYLTQHEQHSLQVHRMGTGILDDFVFPSLADTYKQSRLAVLDFGDVLTLRQSAQLEKIVTEIVQESQGSGWDKTNAELDDFAEYEVEYYAGLLGAMFGLSLVPVARKPLITQIYESMLNLEQGNRDFTGTVKQYQQVNTASIASLYANAIRKGYHGNLTPNQIVTAIRNATNTTARHQSETVLRTLLQHFAIQSRAALAKKNSKHDWREIPIVTFDSKTSKICLSISYTYGETGWPVGESPIGLPPYHNHCRTEIAYTLAGKPLKGTKPGEVGKKGKLKEQNIQAKTPVANWLHQQPRWFQEQVLGVSGAKLFRNGGLTLDKFTDATGQPLTLAQLREQDAEAFKRAGLG